jgi:IS30 family transposase
MPTRAGLPRINSWSTSIEIYRSLFIQARSVLKKELLAHLRAAPAIRRSRHATMKRSGLGKFNDVVSIHDRPAEVEDRAVPGYREV